MFYADYRYAAVVLTLVLSGCVTQASDAPKVPVAGPSNLVAEVPASGTVELHLPSGEALIIADDVDYVEVAMNIRCPANSSRCRDRAAKTRLFVSDDDQRMLFGVTNAPGNSAEIELEVRVPRDRALNVRMKYGDLKIEGVENSVAVRMTAGAIELDVPEQSVGRVDLGATFGDASLSTQTAYQDGRRPTLVGSKVQWDEGVGAHAVQARVRFGDIQLNLTR